MAGESGGILDLVRRIVTDPASIDALRRLILGVAFEKVVLIPADGEANFEWLELVAAMAPDHVSAMRYRPLPPCAPIPRCGTARNPESGKSRKVTLKS